jgi:signal transduction histidine kinase
MIVLPVNCDAPVYHRPWITWGLMGLLTALGVIKLIDVPALKPVGEMIDRIPFIHFPFGSAIFYLITLAFQLPALYIFGLVVEGKTGLKGFPLILAALIGALALTANVSTRWDEKFEHATLVQPLVLALMAISLIWAPKNEVTILIAAFLFRVHVFMLEISVMTFAVWMIVIELLNGVFMSLIYTNAILNCFGALYGLTLGVLMLKLRWVECEGWDVFSVFKGSHLKTIDEMKYPTPKKNFSVFTDKQLKKKSKKKGKAEASDWGIVKVKSEESSKVKKQPAGTSRKAKLERIREFLDAGKPNAAFNEYQLILSELPEFRLPAPDLLAMTQGMFKARMWDDVVPLYELYIEQFPDDAIEVRLRLAGIMVEKQERPMAGLRVLQGIPPKSMSEKQEQYRLQVELRANELIDDGVIEFEGRSRNSPD